MMPVRRPFRKLDLCLDSLRWSGSFNESRAWWSLGVLSNKINPGVLFG